MDVNPSQALGIFLIFIILNAIMYSYGEALKNINENQLDKRIADGNRKAEKILKFVGKPDKFVNTVQLLSTAIALMVGIIQKNVYTLLIALLIISVGVIISKKIGAKHNETVAFLLHPIVSFLVIIFTPFTFIITLVSGLFLRIFGIDPNETYENVTEEEIIYMVNEGHEQGILEEREAEMISNIIELDEKQASDIMIHRNQIVYVSGELTVKEAMDFLIGETYSRFPVVEEDNIDNIIGIIHIKEVIAEYHKGSDENKKLKNIDGIRKPDFIPETRNIDDIFKEMQSEKNHMEIVVDEYGQTVGLLTMEDILEEIVGNIMDEYDVEENNIVQESERVYLVKGMTTLEELEDKLSLVFNEEDYDTLNGLLISELGRIPEENERLNVVVEGVDFDILSVEKNRISQVRMTLPEIDKEENEE